MIKNCRVLINNEAVTVIDYDGVQVQIPSINREAQFVNVTFKNGHYTVVDDSYTEIEPVIDEKPKKKANKKTTVDENAKNESVAELEQLIDGE